MSSVSPFRELLNVGVVLGLPHPQNLQLVSEVRAVLGTVPSYLTVQQTLGTSCTHNPLGDRDEDPRHQLATWVTLAPISLWNCL